MSVVLPVGDDTDVESLVRRARDLEAAGMLCEVVVVNHGSNDATDARCRALLHSIDVYARVPHGGRLQAFHQGAARALGEVLFVPAPELPHTPHDYLKVLSPILAGKADVVVASSGQRSRLRSVPWGNSEAQTDWASQLAFSSIGHLAFRAGVVDDVADLGHVGFDFLLSELDAGGWRVQQMALSRVEQRTAEVLRPYHH